MSNVQLEAYTQLAKRDRGTSGDFQHYSSAINRYPAKTTGPSTSSRRSSSPRASSTDSPPSSTWPTREPSPGHASSTMHPSSSQKNSRRDNREPRVLRSARTLANVAPQSRNSAATADVTMPSLSDMLSVPLRGTTKPRVRSVREGRSNEPRAKACDGLSDRRIGRAMRLWTLRWVRWGKAASVCEENGKLALAPKENRPGCVRRKWETGAATRVKRRTRLSLRVQVKGSLTLILKRSRPPAKERTNVLRSTWTLTSSIDAATVSSADPGTKRSP
ncbi:hypothetical protein GSI_04506 [Ganoderma sinense ZZ0214-1]|uniref:Uncharacterized protein n=1 Tax=Ganoderma sinense ZZ0214-1 TaxID=1077348 RepID=A0A2G8SH75_9APHY|nr:hypothetical protein GSI_04506 [Ganoderma sinense ZZ0214-1]